MTDPRIAERLLISGASDGFADTSACTASFVCCLVVLKLPPKVLVVLIDIFAAEVGRGTPMGAPLVERADDLTRAAGFSPADSSRLRCGRCLAALLVLLVPLFFSAAHAADVMAREPTTTQNVEK
jgi:hypothetical protein